MFLHNISFEKFDIAHGDTLVYPALSHQDELPFEAIVSNPPYSTKWEGDKNPILITDARFAPAGVLAPRGKADLAFTMHILSWLAENGTAAIVEFPGILYRDGAEQKIRQYMIEENTVDAVIQLPGELFFGVSISTCILVLKKSRPRDDVLFIDASDLKVRNGNKNQLSSENIDSIMKMYEERKNIDGMCLLVPRTDIEASGFNLSVSNYIQKEEVHEEEVSFEELRNKVQHVRAQLQSVWKTEEALYPSSLKVMEMLRKCSDVEYVKLEVCELKRGKDIPKTYMTEHTGIYPVYSSQTLKNGMIGKIDTYDYDGTYVTWTTDGAHAGTVFLRINEKFNVSRAC